MYVPRPNRYAHAAPYLFAEAMGINDVCMYVLQHHHLWWCIVDKRFRLFVLVVRMHVCERRKDV